MSDYTAKKLSNDRARCNPKANDCACKEQCQRFTDAPFSGLAFPPYDFSMLYVVGDCAMLIKADE